jgi:hypothetical protein
MVAHGAVFFDGPFLYIPEHAVRTSEWIIRTPEQVIFASE